MIDVAFKEWAVVCRALASGRQSIILRKGGIAEAGGEFHPDHAEFWLYPTYLHQQRESIRPEYRDAFDEVERDRPPPGVVRLQHVVRVASVCHLTKWDDVLAVGDRHIWAESTVRAKFDYRRPGLYLLEVEVAAREPREIVETPEYAGCKTWVPLAGAQRAV